MTGGTVVVLGDTGYNFAAGMTGGMAFVYDAGGNFPLRLNEETAIAQRLASGYWMGVLKAMIERHYQETSSPMADQILASWEWQSTHFWQVCPKEMLARLAVPLSDAREQA
jgi:glutamate synthase (NADPH/NADH) large chain